MRALATGQDVWVPYGAPLHKVDRAPQQPLQRLGKTEDLPQLGQAAIRLERDQDVDITGGEIEIRAPSGRADASNRRTPYWRHTRAISARR